MAYAELTIAKPKALHPAKAFVKFCSRNPGISIGAILVVVMVMLSIGAPLFTDVDPLDMEPVSRFTKPSAEMWFGADAFGRDLWSRTIYGGRISLVVGASVAALATTFGLVIGLLAGYFRTVDAIVMRIMDGMIAIPGILLAIAFVTLTRPSVKAVIIAITIPEVPRVVRLVRAVVLSVRELTYIEAAIALGASTLRILLQHILPSTLAPLMVQATYVGASAIITEAYLSFLGAGTPLEIPSWGNIMAEGRVYFHTAPWIILIPGMFVAVTVLATNILGDGLRDMLDPKIARKM